MFGTTSFRVNVSLHRYAYTMQTGQRSDAGDPANRDEFLKSAKV